MMAKGAWANAAWADALAALALFATDPIGLGGITIRAAPGPVRDRFLALLRGMLPEDRPWRRLPLHVSDDRLLGGLDLAATLQAGRTVAQRGLLAEADGGIVVVAMAERMGAAGVGRLCAVMDRGTVELARDGLDLSLLARFGVVALDEGGAEDERPPPALLDRLAFHVDLTAVPWALADAAVPDLPACSEPSAEWPPTLPDDAAEALCATAMALGVASLRAPLLALRAACTAARQDGRDQVGAADLALAARLVLAPRATVMPESEAPEEDVAEASPETSDTPDTPPEEPVQADKPLEDVVLEAALAALPPDMLARLAQTHRGLMRSRQAGRAGQYQQTSRRGRPIGVRRGDLRSGARLHVLETLKAAAPWQKLRRTDAGRGIAVRPDDFRIVRFRQKAQTTTVFAVDASGSAALHRLHETKGAVELLLAECYVRRDEVALVAFRGRDARVLLPPTGSLVRAKRYLAALPGGGGTPLAAGIDAATTLAVTVRRSGRTPVIALLTDGRANIARDGTGGRPQAEAEALASARLLRGVGVATLLIDTSPRPNPFARRLAEEMDAQYMPLPHADASAVSRAVRGAAGS